METVIAENSRLCLVIVSKWTNGMLAALLSLRYRTRLEFEGTTEMTNDDKVVSKQYRCTGSGWDGVNFPCSGPHSAVLFTCS